MGSLVVRILGAVGAAILSVTMLTTLGSGVASADKWKFELTGMTYSGASSAISGRKGTPVIGTVSGNQLATDDCIVTSWHKSIFLDASGRNSRSTDYVLNLNCNNKLASPGNPGNSVMSPEGVAAKKDQQTAAKINKNPAWCQTSDELAQYCERVCKRSGLCEI
jgi:hypothetical protein